MTDHEEYEEVPESDPRRSPKPLSPPGCRSDGWGNFQPIVAPIMPLTHAQAAALLGIGVPLALARVFP